MQRVIPPALRTQVRQAVQDAWQRAIAEGALMRLRAGERCFDRYRHELGIVT